MSISVGRDSPLPWWREPTRDQWYAYIAAWLGWTLDAFDFPVFFVLIVPMALQRHNTMLAIGVSAAFLVYLIMNIILWRRFKASTRS